ncbi:MAG: phosphoribosylformimino-5-aminoimidazole carboxamide ribotide isomerase [Haloquadratum sp. J07HQX50]|nr:MAG: phosphoribosylformimino-5-aminoimidazole carboxamide ribotide isomerase [Haloquadratum sp. J07HQX50]
MSDIFDSFEVIPAIDIQDQKVVQLVQGETGTETTYGDPVTVAKRWADEGAESLHIVDLDGAFDGERKNAEAVSAIRSAVDIPLQLGGGIRHVDDAINLLNGGISRVVLGTAAVESPSIVREISTTHPMGAVVSLDAKDGEVVVEGWTESTGLNPATAAERFEAAGAAAILFTDIDVEGTLDGVQTTVTERVATSVDIPVIASGGVSTVADIRQLRSVGASAVIIGTALYEDKFSLAEALSL